MKSVKVAVSLQSMVGVGEAHVFMSDCRAELQILCDDNAAATHMQHCCLRDQSFLCNIGVGGVGPTLWVLLETFWAPTAGLRANIGVWPPAMPESAYT